VIEKEKRPNIKFRIEKNLAEERTAQTLMECVLMVDEEK